VPATQIAAAICVRETRKNLDFLLIRKTLLHL